MAEPESLERRTTRPLRSCRVAWPLTHSEELTNNLVVPSSQSLVPRPDVASNDACLFFRRKREEDDEEKPKSVLSTENQRAPIEISFSGTEDEIEPLLLEGRTERNRPPSQEDRGLEEDSRVKLRRRTRGRVRLPPRFGVGGVSCEAIEYDAHQEADPQMPSPDRSTRRCIPRSEATDARRGILEDHRVGKTHIPRDGKNRFASGLCRRLSHPGAAYSCRDNQHDLFQEEEERKSPLQWSARLLPASDPRTGRFPQPAKIAAEGGLQTDLFESPRWISKMHA